MKALITGGNGFLGSHLAACLAGAGHRVRAMVQRGTDLDRLAGLDVQAVEGDLCDEGSLRRACAGRDVVFHMAAVVQDWGPRELFRRVNVEGTRSLLDAAIAEGVRRLVFTSSLAVHRYTGISCGDESWPRDNLSHPYGGSKIACEDFLLEACGGGRIETVIVRPGVVPFGPGDRLAFPELVRSHRRYMHVGHGRARLCTAYAPNLAEGLMRCAEAERAAGQVYVIADDETPTWADLIGDLFTGVGLPAPRRSVPLWAALAGAAAAEAWAGIRRRPPVINRYRVSLVGRDCVFTSRKAHEELGWRPRVPYAEAMAATTRWLSEHLRRARERGSSRTDGGAREGRG